MSRATHKHHSDAETGYLEGVLTGRQIRRLERKASRQQKHARTNVVEIAQYQEQKSLKPRNAKQALHLEYMQTFDQVVTVGPAGTGKTFVTAWHAADLFDQGRINKIVITRPNVPTGRSIGFFPGSLEEKMAPWLAPVISVLKERLGQAAFEIAVKRGDIVYQPIETIRGASFENAFIIVDEAQNITIDEAKALLTRVGENSRIVIDGDLRQCDIGSDSGLAFILNMIKKYSNLKSMTGVVEYTAEEIVRSGLCKAWVMAFDKEEKWKG